MSGPEASSPLQGRREGRIEIVTLNRPAQRNAISAALVDELIAVISAIENDPDVGALVLSAPAPAFAPAAIWAGSPPWTPPPVAGSRPHRAGSRA